jgi:pimeloyl-ACP methyl ester carboxylesterase
MQMLKWTLRIGGGIAGVIALLAVTGVVAFTLWKGDAIKTLEANSQVIATARGDVEYATLGDGVPFLYFHGNPGGYDQPLIGHRLNPDKYADRMTIGVSRPGYLRTPVSSGATFEEQADLFAALLDELKIDRVVVIAASGGGYPGVQFAMRHPERCIALVMLATSVNYEPIPEGGWKENTRQIPVPNVLAWALQGPLFDAVATEFIPDLDTSNPELVAHTKGILLSVLFPMERRIPGSHNDTLQRDFPEIDSWPLERITAPTLILHGDADENSTYRGATYLAEKIPNATLVTFENADHNMILTRGEEIKSRTDQFVAEVLLAETEPETGAVDGQSQPPSP